ncbi:MAG: NrfD/PsrC family molybdoenzyme membrane anchor subunit [Bacteroidia bacterium]
MEFQEEKLQIETELLSTVGKRFKGQTTWITVLSLIVLAGIICWIIQLREGLVVTAMRDYVSWGIYISLLFFFVGISLIGALVSSVLRFSGAKWRYPLTRIAEAITLSAVFFAGFMPVLDMGRPERLLFLITHGRIQSPILWDVVAIATYFFGSLIFFFLPLIPDVALMRDRLTDAPKWKNKLYKILAVGWNGNYLQRKYLKQGIKIMSIVILPLAISVHTVSAWLISMTMRPGWNTSIMGPYFVFGALMAGCAIMIIMMAILRRGYHLQHYLSHSHFSKLAMLLLALTCTYLYFNISKYGVPAYKMQGDEKDLLNDLFSGNNSISFWAVQIFGLIIPIIMLSFQKLRNSIKWTVVVSSFVLIGALLNRYLIVIPNMLHPFVPIQNAPAGYATYFPTLIEWTISAASIAGFVLVMILLFKPFPIVTIWETVEGVEKSGDEVIGLENMSNQNNLSAI